MSDYTIGRLRGQFCLIFYRDGRRHRHALGTADPREAERRAPAVYTELTRPRGRTVADVWGAYVQEKAGRAIIATMKHTWRRLRDRFGPMDAEAITVADCRAHTAARRGAGIGDGTILTELGHLRTVVHWAAKQKMIACSPYIELPPKPAPRERHLTREQARALIDAAGVPHVRLYVILALSTGARNAALLDLTWDRCDFERELIDLRNPFIRVPHKGRALVPMNRTVKAALQEARRAALSPCVIEWAGKKVTSVKRGLRHAAKQAGLGGAWPHLLRHSAAVHMAEGGVPMVEIAQFLGHANSRLTESTYARFSPDYLKNAAQVLEYDDVAEPMRRKRMR